GLLALSLLPQGLAKTLGRPSRGRDKVKRHETTKTRHLKRYLEAAEIYDARGQIRQALSMWHAAEQLQDQTMEGLACQAHLKLPSATEKEIYDHQRNWAQRHAKPNSRKGMLALKPVNGHRKIKIGYHCGFFPGDVIRAMMQGVVEHHDRAKF